MEPNIAAIRTWAQDVALSAISASICFGLLFLARLAFSH
jgi:hypothetical protein